MLLHWIQTRWITGLTTAPGWSGLLASVGWEVSVFSDVCSVGMAGFYHAESCAQGKPSGIPTVRKLHLYSV